MPRLKDTGPGRSPADSESAYDAHAAAHDVNNLLHVIIGCCERLRVGASPSQNEEVDHITVAAEHAAALSSRVLGSRGPTDAILIDLHGTLQRLHGLLARIAGDRVGFSLTTPPAETWVRMHEGDLLQVLVNLTVNARDAMPDGGTFTIDCGVMPGIADGDAGAEVPPARYIQLRVCDTGIGMTAEVRERVFERFFTTKTSEGTGHGLATVQSIVQQYGGTIELRSEPGRGAEFLIQLPIVESTAPALAGAPQVASGAGQTVLVVDDEPFAREIVVSFLEAGGYGALEAGSAREALEILTQGSHTVDLVAADVTMPDATGIDLAEWIAEVAPAVPVLLVSGDTAGAIATETGGRVAFLQKPFGQQAFSSKVAEVLLDARRKGQVGSALTLSGTGSLIDTVPAPVFIVQHGRFAYVNRAFAGLLGFPEHRLVGRTSVEWVVPDDRHLFPTDPQAVDAAEAPAAATQVRVRRADGAERNLLVSTVPIEHAAQPALLGVALDVTLQPDAAIVAARMAALGRLAGGIAHDYNNLLLVIGGHLERLRNNLPADSALQKDVDAVAAAAGRAGTLTDNLLSFGRRQLLAPELLHLATVVTGVAAEARPSLAGIDVRVECARDVPPIEADGGRLREVLWHLLENAREAMSGGEGTLTLALDTTTVDRGLKTRFAFLSEGSLFVRLRVIDTGRGMAPSVAAHAFEPFFTTKGKGRGAGMGLASVYGLVKQSGGFVFAERTGERGTCMTVLLPPAVHESASRKLGARPARASHHPNNSVLLVEDDEGVRELLRDLLQANGYDVQAAVSAEEAQDHASRRTFGLLLTDLDLPGMDGARLAAALTAQQPELRVIVMSGYPDDGTIDAALRRRPAFLRKPFRSAQLLAEVGRALAPADEPPDAIERDATRDS